MNKVSGGDGIPAELFQIPKDDAVKRCTQYASKFGKVSSGHRTGKGLFLLQSPRRAMPKNVQTITQMCSSHVLARWGSKSFKLGFSCMWTKNFQTYKLDLEEAEEPEICWFRKKAREFQKKYLLLPHWLHSSLWLCDSQKNWKILKKMGITDHFTCFLRNLYTGQEATVRTRHGTTDWFKIEKWVRQGCILSPCLLI